MRGLLMGDMPSEFLRQPTYRVRMAPAIRANELDFLAKLGTHASLLKTPRAALLRGYLKAPRTDWGQVDRKRCLAYARAALLKEGQANGQ